MAIDWESQYEMQGSKLKGLTRSLLLTEFERYYNDSSKWDHQGNVFMKIFSEFYSSLKLYTSPSRDTTLSRLNKLTGSKFNPKFSSQVTTLVLWRICDLEFQISYFKSQVSKIPKIANFY